MDRAVDGVDDDAQIAAGAHLSPAPTGGEHVEQPLASFPQQGVVMSTPNDPS